ncbi:MAG: winged helix-turn-helix transcriptional regulator [Chloroflexi bacterium]|nr:winged helix-turn-helix transcriptional regulator [Chloroflexota bacterium]
MTEDHVKDTATKGGTFDRFYGMPPTAFWNWVMIRHIQDSMWKVTDRLAGRCGLSASQYITLFMVCSAKHPVKQADLGPWLFQEQNTISGLVSRMEKKGLIRRERSREDRRQVLIGPTAVGHELVRKAYEAICDISVDFLSSISMDEHEQLAALLTKLRAKAFTYLDICAEEMDGLVGKRGEQSA